MEDQKLGSAGCEAGHLNSIDREDGPGRSGQTKAPEIVHKPDTLPDGQRKVEISPQPSAPELSPKPDKLNN